MDVAKAFPDLLPFLIQGGGALLFGLVFYFLFRQSGIIYFVLWAAAWGVQSLALAFGYAYLHDGAPWWLGPYALLEFAFALMLVAAARAGFSGSMRNWRGILRWLIFLPFFLALVYALGGESRVQAFHVTHALVLCFAYLYNFISLRGDGIGRSVFRFSLLLLAAAFLQHALVFLYLYRAGAPGVWRFYVEHDLYFDFGLHAMLAFAAMAMWIESQHDRVRAIEEELDRVRSENRQSMDLDRLTGLLNQSALARRMEENAGFQGVVTVCDMDNFKEINDSFGHLAGDEILRNIGHLLRASIRHDDEAFRWGGDEFVILFRNQHLDVARKRMAEIEARLRSFRVRGHGVLPISFSWGIAEAGQRPLREALDEADRNMYTLKRSRPIRR